ncbi:MAG: AAA family ATPase [Verrucomicrobiota bacterium]|jgi:AAA15 family ATPase/GTPase
MFNRVEITNFKSIRNLEFEAKRVNVFIGEPNTGKSNLLEALAFFSVGVFDPGVFKEIYRFRTLADLFFDQDVSKDIGVVADSYLCKVKFTAPSFTVSRMDDDRALQTFQYTMAGATTIWRDPKSTVRYYEYKSLSAFQNLAPGFLKPPFGDNLAAILYSNKTLRQSIGALFRERGFRLEIKPVQHELLFAKEVNDELYSYPWDSLSETLRRIVFYRAALETNQNAVLLLDEPESNTFPFYTKYLAERIALDASNQFFITTHNPYLLSSVVEKTPGRDLAVFVTRMKQFETTVSRISEGNLSELLELDADAFFNLDRLAGE